MVVVGRRLARLLTGAAVAAVSTAVVADVAAATPTPSASHSLEPLTPLIGSGRSPEPRTADTWPAETEPAGIPRLDVDLVSPDSIAVAPDGTVYVGDSANEKIRVLGPDRGEVRTLAGEGRNAPFGTGDGDGGRATHAYLDNPRALALDPGRTLYFVDDSNDRRPIRAVDLHKGTIRSLPIAPGDVVAVSDLAVDRHGALYVADGAHGRVCRFDPRSRRCRTVADTRKKDVDALAIGPDGTLYGAPVTEGDVWAINPKTGAITTVAGTGSTRGMLGDDGPATSAALGFVTGLDVSQEGILYLTDQLHYRLRAVNLRTGVITTVARSGEENRALGNVGDVSRGNWDVAVDGDGTVYLADSAGARIWTVGDTVSVKSSHVTRGPDKHGHDSVGHRDGTGVDLFALLGGLVVLAMLFVTGATILRSRRT